MKLRMGATMAATPIMLTPGRRVGSYDILAKLGAGGMGEVYKAHDTTLNRDVAIKVLPDVMALDPERVTRFRREAQSLAALNHPNVALIYGLEDAATAHAYVDTGRKRGSVVLTLGTTDDNCG